MQELRSVVKRGLCNYCGGFAAFTNTETHARTCAGTAIDIRANATWGSLLTES